MLPLMGIVSIRPTRGSAAAGFSGELAPVRRGERWGYIDRQGVTVIQPSFVRARRLAEGLAAVTHADSYESGFLDRGGALVIARGHGVGEPFHCGLAMIVDPNDRKR